MRTGDMLTIFNLVCLCSHEKQKLRYVVPAQWRLTGGGTQMPFSVMWTHIRVWNLRMRCQSGRFMLQSYVKRTSGAVSTLTTEGRSSSRRDASGAIKMFVLVAPES